MSPLYIYDASAGAGKTHALVYYYLCQALREPTAFQHILAITFTNKATQEMKERILTYLRRLAQGEDHLLANLLSHSLDCSKDQVQSSAQALLHAILHNYSHFSVTTIDSLFNTLLSAFSRELHIEPDYTLALNLDPILEDVLHRLWKELPSQPDLYNLLLKRAFTRLQQGKSWDLNEEITRLSRDLVQRAASQINRANQLLSNQKAAELWTQLLKESEEIRETLSQKAAHLLLQIEKQDIPTKELVWGKQGLFGYLEKLAQKKIIPPTSRALQAEKGDWIRKTSTRYAETHPLVENEWRSLFIDLIAYAQKHHFSYQTFQEIHPLRYAWMTNQQVAEQLERQQMTHQQLLMPYLPSLLHRITRETPQALLEAKIGTIYNRLLIDEFQDVSQSQWQNLAPFLKNGLKSGQSSLIVGDIKQSIYRWRGGDPSLLLTQVEQEIGSEHIQRRELPFNWRSEEEIIAFNNQIFEEAPNHLYQALAAQVVDEVKDETKQTHILEQIKQVPKAYQHAVQQVPPSHAQRSSKGYIHIRFLSPPQKREEEPKEPAYDWKKEAITHTIQKIEHLQRTGYSAKEIALLVRDHAEGERLLNALLTHQKSDQADPQITYDALTSGGFPLVDHPAIALLMAALHYLEDQNPHALATLVHLYQTYPKKRKPSCNPHLYFTAIAQEESILPYLPEAFTKLIDTLTQLPLTHLVVKLNELFHLKQPDALPYLELFQDHVHRLQVQGGLSHFLRFWEQEGEKLRLPTQAHTDSLTITTIHQAKGLAYKVVILPFCAWALDHPPHAAPILWSQTTQSPLQQLGNVSMYYKKALKETYYRHAYYQEHWQVYLEQLNLLYVAFTRAQEQLHVLAPEAASRIQVPKNVAQLLRNTLLATHALSTDQQELQIGQPPQVDKKKFAPLPTPTSTKKFYLSSKVYEKALALLTSPPDPLGTWWHDFFASVKTFEDFPKVLAHHLRTGRIDQERAQEVKNKIKKWSQNEYLLDWFSGHYLIKSEESIVFPNGKTLRPDRVMIQDKKAIVLDFKSGKPQAAHHDQVSNYMKFLGEMGYQPVAGYLFYIYADQVIPVSSA